MSDQDRPASGRAWPTEIKLRKDRRTLTVTFDNGEVHELAAEYLRVKSPSAEVQGHAPEERKTVPGKRNVAILEVHPIGNYAVRLVFEDPPADLDRTCSGKRRRGASRRESARDASATVGGCRRPTRQGS